MTGISEILVLILLICAILIIPRMMKPAPSARSSKNSKGLTAGMRAGIVVSLLLPVVSGLITKPWNGNPITFVITGILPVALAWGAFWILSARKK